MIQHKKAETGEQAQPQKPSIDKKIIAAHEEAEKDMDKDPDLSIHHPNDDLDEGESARLGDGQKRPI